MSLERTPENSDAGIQRGPGAYAPFIVAVIFIVLGPLLLGGVGATYYFADDTPQRPAAEREQRRQEIVETFGLAGGGSVVLGLVLLVLVWTGRKRQQATQPKPGDPAEQWASWTLHQRSGSWVGECGSRRVVVQRAFRRRVPGPVHIRVACSAAARVTLVRRADRRTPLGALLDSVAETELGDGEAFGFPHCEVATSDSEWAHRWLSDPQVESTVESLIASAGESTVSVVLRPNHVGLNLKNARPDGISAQRTRQWLDALETLAESAEAQPEPAVLEEPAPLEKLAMDPSLAQRRANRTTFVVVGVMLVLVVALTTILLVLV